MRRTLSVIGLLLTALLLTACGGDNDPDSERTGSGKSAQPSPINDADVSFAQAMIPHHQQAIEMAQLVPDRVESPEVAELAADIEAAQTPEIEQLSAWLGAWGEDVPSDDTGHGNMGHGNVGSPMSGMMTAEDMGMLEEADGAEFERMFLEMMIEHHQGAVSMAQTEVADGEHPGAVAMAEQIIATQNEEIDLMLQLLGS